MNWHRNKGCLRLPGSYDHPCREGTRHIGENCYISPEGRSSKLYIYPFLIIYDLLSCWEFEKWCLPFPLLCISSFLSFRLAAAIGQKIPYYLLFRKKVEGEVNCGGDEWKNELIWLGYNFTSAHQYRFAYQ